MNGKPATDPECRRMIAEYWTAKEDFQYASTRSPVDIRKAELRMYRAAAWIAGGVDLRPFYGRVPTLDEINTLDQRRKP